MKDIITGKVFHVQTIHFKDGDLLQDCTVQMYNGFLIIAEDGNPAAWVNADMIEKMDGVKLVSDPRKAMDFFT